MFRSSRFNQSVCAANAAVASIALVFGLCVVNALSPTTAHAEGFEWRLDNPVPGFPVPFPPHYYYNETGGRIVSMQSEFDSTTKRLKFVTVLAAQPGEDTPSSFKLVINNGPMPWTVGLAAVIYFDASEAGNPKLTVYGYNAGHALADRSWIDGDGGTVGDQAPDRICTSVSATPCGTWVNSLTVSDTAGGRRFTFDIDATRIVNHVPLYTVGAPPAPWYGAGFSSLVGIWFHPAVGRVYTYDANGYIDGVAPGREGAIGFFDAQDLDTNTRPVCSVSASAAVLRPGQAGQVVLEGFDPDSSGSDPSLSLITSPNAPSSSLPQGVTCTFSSAPRPGSGVIVGRYLCDIVAPQTASDSNYSFTVAVTDKEGAATECQAGVAIKNTAPVCGLLLGASNPAPLACEGAVTTVEVVSSVPPDADGDVVTASYGITCSSGSGSIAVQSPTQLVASLTGPGLGNLTECQVTGTVSDGFSSTNCSIPVSVPGCRLDCANTPLGSAVVDSCGVCGGNNACIDCAGVLFGSAVVDRCGVCGGGGDSCLGCEGVSNFNEQLALDGGANSVATLNRRGLNVLRRALGNTAAVRRFAQRKVAQSQEQYLKAWRAIWGLPVNVVSCTNATFCQAVAGSGSDRLVEYNASLARLVEISNEVAARLRKARQQAQAAKLVRDVKALEATIGRERGALVLTSSACSSPI